MNIKKISTSALSKFLKVNWKGFTEFLINNWFIEVKNKGFFSKDEEYINSTNFMNNQNYIIAENKKYIPANSKRDLFHLILVWHLLWFAFLFMISIFVFFILKVLYQSKLYYSFVEYVLLFFLSLILLYSIFSWFILKIFIKWRISLLVKKDYKTEKLFYNWENYYVKSSWPNKMEEVKKNNIDKFIILELSQKIKKKLFKRNVIIDYSVYTHIINIISNFVLQVFYIYLLSLFFTVNWFKDHVFSFFWVYVHGYWILSIIIFIIIYISYLLYVLLCYYEKSKNSFINILDISGIFKITIFYFYFVVIFFISYIILVIFFWEQIKNHNNEFNISFLVHLFIIMIIFMIIACKRTNLIMKTPIKYEK